MNRSRLFASVPASLGLRSAGLVMIWWILAEGRFDDFLFILVCLVAVLAASYRLWPAGAWRWRPLGLIAFAPYFFRRSLEGGIDVARRAFSPSLPLHPEVIVFDLSCSEKQSLLLTWIVSLLPGTAGVRLEDGTLQIHVLDSRLPVRESVRDLEKRIARLCD